MDLVEVNEAFAPQYLAVERELGLDRERTNVDGGAIALGHPLGASGARITVHLLHALRRRGGRYGLGAACIGGGQGIAVIVESYRPEEIRWSSSRARGGRIPSRASACCGSTSAASRSSWAGTGAPRGRG